MTETATVTQHSQGGHGHVPGPLGPRGTPPIRRSMIQIERTLRRGDETAAAALYWQAFGRKLVWPLGPEHRCIEFLATHLRHDRAICAYIDDELIEVAGYRHQKQALTGGGLRDVLRSYGWVRGLPRVALLAFLERQPPAGVMVMDGISVTEAHRGNGVGTMLLAETASIAAELGYRKLQLDVVDTNPRAQDLYSRNGFVATETEQTPYLRRPMGFSASTTMERDVSDPVGAVMTAGLGTVRRMV
jgi:ribosomal protein S18 acetylase RimI-like enzyme